MKTCQICLLLLLAVGPPAIATAVAAEKEAAPAAAKLTRAEQEEFLRKAEIVEKEGLSTGITRSERATLSDGQLTHDAHVQTIDVQKFRYETPQGVEMNFRDSYKYNIAAYRLDKLLDLNMVPVSVERDISGKPGAVSWWVDDVLMTAKDRYLKNIEPPDSESWNNQVYQVRVFNQWIFNTDLNLGNVLITKDWKVWSIDFTRAFRTFKQIQKPNELVCIDRRFYEALRALDASDVTRELHPLLTKDEVNGLMARRDRVIEFFDKKAAEKGETAAFCNVSRE